MPLCHDQPTQSHLRMNDLDEFYRGFWIDTSLIQIGIIQLIGNRERLCLKLCEKEFDDHIQKTRAYIDQLLIEKSAHRGTESLEIKELVTAIRYVWDFLEPELKALLILLNSHSNNSHDLEDIQSITNSHGTVEAFFYLAQLSRSVCDVMAYHPISLCHTTDPYLGFLLDTTPDCYPHEKQIKIQLNPLFYQAIKVALGSTKHGYRITSNLP